MSEAKVIADLSNIQEVTNSIYYPLYENRSKYLVLYGGSNSGKSWYAGCKLIYRILTDQNHRFLVLRKYAAHIRNSVFQLLCDVIEKWNLSEFAVIYKSEFRIVFPDFQSEIIFSGLDEREKIKSIQGLTGIWIEEATEMDELDIDQLSLRLRGIVHTYKQMIISFNPISENHFLKAKFFDSYRKDVTICHSTYKNNRFIPKEDFEDLEALQFTNKLYYDIYCLGLWGVEDKTNKFLYNFSKKKHVSPEPLPIYTGLPIWVSFDFNVDPMTVVVAQRVNLIKLNIINEIRLENSNVFEACHEIKKRFNGFIYLATGDASGNSRSAGLGKNISFWKIIKKELGLKDQQLYVRSKNLGLKESRVICNTVLDIIEVQINENCTTLINDCIFAATDFDGTLIKDSKKNGNHMLDGFRYLLDSNFPDIIDKPRKYLIPNKQLIEN